ncbi:MAG: glycoside hydrolase family 27 protein [Lachnospiraceae bacterium]|nr:glycoside hydrolase family 27 protein [Lachnospiraceae bacterium]
MDKPVVINDKKLRFDSFSDGEVLYGKRKGRLPAMGWNSWNAFGSGNTEALTKAMADKIVELGLDRLGYEYVVLDDGCYKPERVNGLLSNEEVKFPSGFKALADYIHGKGLKFGMYNDIGTNLCAGAAVGTCGHETEDAKAYLEWGIDFIKVDNCYYLWDNATFSNPENARFTYGPAIRQVTVSGFGFAQSFMIDKPSEIGTVDGTGPDPTPIGELSTEVRFQVKAPKEGEYDLIVEYATAKEAGQGEWLQVAVGEGKDAQYFYDDLLKHTSGKESFRKSQPLKLRLKAGVNTLRLMNHRRQENTLCSYARLKEAFYEADPDNDVLLSICEWGKTGPHNWGYKVGDSWRILNDISFAVGADGNNGRCAWESDYTTSIAAQYNKAVIMDEFAGLDKGWNDPDMMVIGMDGLTETMCRTHMAMWCMMNSPLMLGLDLRRVEKGDWIHNIIANKDLIGLNQDKLGVQAKRIWSSAETEHPDTAYIRDNNRVDVLAKPLADGSVAVSFINLSGGKKENIAIDSDRIERFIGAKMQNKEAFVNAASFKVKDLWTGRESELSGNTIRVDALEPYDNVTLKITP